jgi:ubiquinone/menaquinone biosynthesis C-methylase UbiE
MAAPSANEDLASVAFTKQAPKFDTIYSSNTIIDYKRTRVRTHFEKYLQPKSKILELNSGTGEDAVYFSRLGHKVHATDISAGMQQMLNEKVIRTGLQSEVSSEICSFTRLHLLQNKGPYDAVFSNFAGLNCSDNLQEVLDGLSPLLKPGGILTMVVLPRFCLWETLLLLKGKFKTATRRLFSANGRKANIEGESFKCWYYNPSFFRHFLKDKFNVLSIEGLCTFVPPSYIERFPEKHPGWYAFLQRLENRYKGTYPWRSIGDYYIITLRKKEY